MTILRLEELKQRDVDYLNFQVKIYRNLRNNCFSVIIGGRVNLHIDRIALKNVKFVVRPAGRRKVIETNRKNVHAFVVGTPVLLDKPLFNPVIYNPYFHSDFYFAATGVSVHEAEYAWLDDGKLYV